jgi:putative flavoprotein involved in K+ transport
MKIEGTPQPESEMRTQYDVIVIGGGQAGLAMGYELARRGFDFLILDGAERTGASWRNRWESLTLFTPARYSALPGLAFPAEPEHLPAKDEVADYLERYATHLSLPIRHSESVVSVTQLVAYNAFVVTTERNCYLADQVVVATGPFQKPVVPKLSAALPSDVQVHSSQYRSPDQLPAGDVLVVGGGNSGVQIASELARTRRTWLSISETLPTLPQQFLGRSIFWWLDTLGGMSVSVDSRLGKRAREREVLIGKSAAACASDDGVRLLGRTEGVEGGMVFTRGGGVVEPSAIVWATGFTQDFSFVQAPVLDPDGRALHQRGVTSVRGLYFLGLPWQHTRGSALIGWVGRDASFLAQRIASA